MSNWKWAELHLLVLEQRMRLSLVILSAVCGLIGLFALTESLGLHQSRIQVSGRNVRARLPASPSNRYRTLECCVERAMARGDTRRRAQAWCRAHGFRAE